MGCVTAARAHGVDILDGVYNDLGNAEGFARECAEARDMGFDGKTLIHPNQIGPCNAAFSPSAEEVAHARKIIAAFNLPENKDKGSSSSTGAWWNGCMPIWQSGPSRLRGRSRSATSRGNRRADLRCHGPRESHDDEHRRAVNPRMTDSGKETPCAD
jgi:hypothetical protein